MQNMFWPILEKVKSVLDSLESWLNSRVNLPYKKAICLLGQRVDFLSVEENVQNNILKYYKFFTNLSHKCPSISSNSLHVCMTDAFPAAWGFKEKSPDKGKVPKEDYVDIGPYRLITKSRTGLRIILKENFKGVWFDISTISDLNQVINVVNVLLAVAWLRVGYSLFHASAIVFKDNSVALFIGKAGKGKSTALMSCIGDGMKFMSNDRVIIGTVGKSKLSAIGYPKLPRLNPGTMLHNPKLVRLLSMEDRVKFLTMDNEVLWNLEDKRDICLSEIYSSSVLMPFGQLSSILFLNWDRDHDSNMDVKKIPKSSFILNVNYMFKDLGVFDLEGISFISYQEKIERLRSYYDKIAVYEVRGKFSPEGLREWLILNLHQ